MKEGAKMFINTFSDLSTGTPACHPGAPMLGASFKLDTDISQLFPYINAVIKDSRYFDKPHHIKFGFDEKIWVLYPENGVGAPFETRGQAGDGINRLIEFLNDLYARKVSVNPDHEKYKPVPVLEIFKLLPRTNCGECDFPTCMAFAAALSKGEGSCDRCPGLDTPEIKEKLFNIGLK